MKLTATACIFFALIFNSAFAQQKLDDASLANLVKIGELYYNGGHRIMPTPDSKEAEEKLEGYRMPVFETLIEQFKVARAVDNSVLDVKYLKRPSDADLYYWYVIREIFYNMKKDDPKDNTEIAKTFLDSAMDSRELLANYYYRIGRGIDFNEADLSKFSFDIDAYGFKDASERGIFFLSISSCFITRFRVLLMVKNFKKLLEFEKKLPTFNGKPYYEFTDFDFEDFEFVGYDKVEWYKKREMDAYYESLLAHYTAVDKLKGSKKSKKIFSNSILSHTEYFKYSKLQEVLRAIYKKNT